MRNEGHEDQGPAGRQEPFGRFREAVAWDLTTLAVLHNKELSREIIAELQEDIEAGSCFNLIFGADRSREAEAMFQEGVRLIGSEPNEQVIDDLAADYASIYLTHALRASPYESVWIDEEGLAMQEPMFQIRAWYERYGLAVQDWRIRSDDHLVLQLQFCAHLLHRGEPLGDVARFLDEHLLRWITDFATAVASRCATPFYAGLAALTAAYTNELRDLLAEHLDEPRPGKEEIEKRMSPHAEVALPDPKFVPGSAPSW